MGSSRVRQLLWVGDQTGKSKLHRSFGAFVQKDRSGGELATINASPHTSPELYILPSCWEAYKQGNNPVGGILALARQWAHEHSAEAGRQRARDSPFSMPRIPVYLRESDIAENRS